VGGGVGVERSTSVGGPLASPDKLQAKAATIIIIAAASSDRRARSVCFMPQIVTHGLWNK
jgi:hypothetical protein